MAQRFCEVCSDPLPLEAEGTMCDTCIEAVDAQLAEIAEERECATPAPNVEGLSSSETPDETPAEDKSTSESGAALDVTVATEFESLDSTLSQTNGSRTDVVKAEKPKLPCESCGSLERTLHTFKHPAAASALELCKTCYDAEQAAITHVDDPMQGKVVHPDEAEREEVISMDNEDAELYNREVLISMESTIDEVYARIALLEGKLQRAKLQLRASKTTLFMRIEHMKKDEREAEYKRLNERDAKRRSRKSATSDSAATGVKRSASPSHKPKRSKAQQFREIMQSNGFSNEAIEAKMKELGIE